MNQFRQGDLLFVKEADESRFKPDEHQGLNTPKPVIESATTGHSHTITRGLVQRLSRDGRRGQPFAYMFIPDGGAELLHPEHETIKVPSGLWAVIRQWEVHHVVED